MTAAVDVNCVKPQFYCLYLGRSQGSIPPLITTNVGQGRSGGIEMPLAPIEDTVPLCRPGKFTPPVH